MAGYFFDSSALVKLYHAETGTPIIDQIVNTPDSQIRISGLTPAELASAFAVAEHLVEGYAFDLRLRALDALQLAVALELRNQALVDYFVAAVAGLEAFSVINPEHP